MDDMQTTSMKRELFEARWFLCGLITYARNHENWDDAQRQEWITNRLQEAAETLSKMDREANYRNCQESEDE